MRCFLFVAVFVILSTVYADSAVAQVLQGPWVSRSEKRIDQARQTAIRVIVLDGKGDPAAGALVTIDEVRRAFALGFVPPAHHWPGVDWHKPVWRCFSAVSLSPMTGWASLQPTNHPPGVPRRLKSFIQSVQHRGFAIRWGPGISTDVDGEPNWAAGLHGKAMRSAIHHYLAWIFTHFGRRVGQFDLFADSLDHPLSKRGIDLRSLRVMLNKLKTRTPQPRLCVHFRDALIGPRFQPAFTQVVRMQQAFVPIDGISITQHFHRRVLHLRLRRALHQWDQLGLPLVLRLQVGGQNPAQARINLEVVLRTVFSDPNVVGLVMSGLTPDQVGDPASALLGKGGKPSASGKLFDNLFYKHWRTHRQVKADALGDVRCRVFAGAYHITAKMPGNATAATDVWIPRKQGRQLVVVQPPKSKPKAHAKTQPASEPATRR